MRELLQVGDAILTIIEGDWERIDELKALFALRNELIAALDSTERADELLRQDQRLHDSCVSQLNRLRTRRRFNAYSAPGTDAVYIDQKG